VKYRTTVGERTFEIEVEHDQLVRVNHQPVYIDLAQVGGLPLYELALNDGTYLLFVDEGRGQYQVEVRGQVYSVQVVVDRPPLAPRHATCHDEQECRFVVTAPLAGLLLTVTAVGDQVAAGQVVAVVESMKMQMELKAPQTGVVDVVHVPSGTNVSQGAELVTIVGRGPK
jgi:biotin carboxyl carrier protein